MEKNLTLNKSPESHVDLRLNSAVQLSMIEIVLGSLFHSLKVPFTGHMLSLNQAIYLSRLSKHEQNRFEACKACVEVSALVAFFKTLSPGGKRLGPMISIFLQGLLFTLGIASFGRNKLGHSVGLLLLSMWAFLQPLLSYFIIFGVDLVPALDYALSKINKFGIETNYILTFIIGVYCAKGVFGLALLYTTQNWENEKWNKFDHKIKKLGKHLPLKNKKSQTHLRSYLKELLHPFFLLTMTFFIMLLTFQGLSLDEVLIRSLRPIAILTFIFIIGRSSLVKKMVSFFEARSKYFHHFMQRVRSGLASLLNEKSSSKQDFKSLTELIQKNNFQKILILGAPGSGKTTLAKSLSHSTDITHIETDLFRWKNNQKGKAEKGNFLDSLKSELKNQSWIIEGNYKLIKDLLPEVDLIIELELPKWVILFRLLKRDISRFIKKPFSQSSDFIWVLRKGLRSYDKSKLNYKKFLSF